MEAGSGSRLTTFSSHMEREDGREISSVGGDDVSESRSCEAQAGLAYIM